MHGEVQKKGVTTLSLTPLGDRCADVLSYSSRKRRFSLSTLPSVSTMRCSPVKKGWHWLHISTCNSGLVEPVVYEAPQEHVTTASAWYLGWIPVFIWLWLLGGWVDAGALPGASRVFKFHPSFD